VRPFSQQKAYKVNHKTLYRRINGGTSREDYTPKNKKLSSVEEEVLIKDILSLDTQGLPPSIALVRDMANSIHKARGGAGVGVNWLGNFLKRTPALKPRLGRAYESQRRLCEDPQIIRGWFELVKNTINKHGILPQDIYNFDETGFQMGQISASMVVTDASKTGRPKQVKPTNTQWVTLIQGACADGSTIPPSLIFKGKELNHTWFYQGLPSTWTFTVSPNGWTTDQIGYQWIQHFEKHTRQKTVGSKRLLVLDNHGSHTTPQFRTFCEDNSIILLWMPPHSSHMLQPMDVGCFDPLKTAFSKQNQDLIRNHVFHITKEDFITTFHQAFLTSFTQANVQAGFRGSDLHPFDPEAVLSHLDPVLRSSSQPLSQESCCAKTPSNTKEVDKQATLIKQRLERHQSSSPTPILEALNQLSKGTQVLAASTALLQTQITTLQRANEAMHVRRKRTRKALISDNALSVSEVQAMGGYKVVEAEIIEEMPRPKKRPPTCSKCHIQGHNMRQCRSFGQSVHTDSQCTRPALHSV
jgi:hypothetical protein